MQEDWLVTGFPALRARTLVRLALALRPEVKLTLLVDRERRSAAEAVLSELDPLVAPRVKLLLCQVSAIDFGLAGATYMELARRTTRVHHLYQTLDRNLDERTATRVNVHGAREVIEFARVAPKLERVVHYSSIFVSGDRTGVVLEDELEAGQGFRSRAEETLALAEAMLKRAPGLPLTVLRAAQVVGDSESGETDRLDGPYPLIAYVVGTDEEDVALPLPARADARLEMIPVDFLAKAGILLGESPAALGETLHLSIQDPVTARVFVERAASLCEKGVVMGLAPAPLGKTLSRHHASRVFGRYVAALNDWITTPVRHDDARAKRLLEAVNLERPELDAILPKMVEHVRARVRAGRFEAPDAAEATSVVA
jgi:thioester reductase-like protein